MRLEVFDGERFGSPAAGVEAVHLAGFCFVIEREQIAPHAVHVRLHHAHHGVGCNSRVDSVAAFFQDVRAGLRSKKLGSGDNPVLGDHHGAALSRYGGKLLAK